MIRAIRSFHATPARFVQNPYPQRLDLRDVSVADAVTATAVGDYGTIIRTVDGGETWERNATPSRVFLMGSQCIDGETMTAVGRYGAVLRAECPAD